jgi:hypothetical protein
MIIETRAVRFDSITLDTGATLAPWTWLTKPMAN